MANLITINGDSRLAIVVDNITSMHKISRASSFKIRICFQEDVQFFSFSTIEDRDSVFSQISAMFDVPVDPPIVEYPPLFIGGNFGGEPPALPEYPPMFVGGNF